MQQDLFQQDITENSENSIFDKAKSIEEIYHEISKHDIVLTVDAPLAAALNKRAGKDISYTPRQLALKIAEENSFKIYSKFEIVNLISRLEKRSVKVIHQFIESILDMMNHSSSMEEVLEFSSGEEKKLMKYFDKYPVLEKGMMNFDTDHLNNKKIAVINEEAFSLLDSLFIPPGFNYTKIDIFTADEFKIDKTYIFNSSKDLISKTIDLISKENMNDAAIVISPDSDENILIKAKLKEKGISTVEALTLSKDLTIGLLLHLTDLGLRYKDLNAGDIYSVSAPLNIKLSRHGRQSALSDLLRFEKTNSRLIEVTKLLSNIEKLSFSRFAEKLSSDFKLTIPVQYNLFLEESGIANTKISEQSLIEFRYLLDNFDKEIGRVEQGVLFADPASSAFIDRKKIIYLDLDNTWMKNVPERIYYDKNKEEINSFNNFKTVLQQGDQRLYFVKSQSVGDKIIPCYYFNYIEDVKDFTDKFFSPVNVAPQNDDKAKHAKILNVKNDEAEEFSIKSISPSSLNQFYLCPKKYEFSRVIPREDTPQMLKGNLIHEFAELYFHYPEFCKQNNSKILNKIVSDYIGEFSMLNEKLAQTEFAEAMSSISKFIDENNFVRKEIEPGDKITPNDLMKYFKLEKKYFNTEVFIENDSSRIRGKIDLLSNKLIVDYKSGPVKEIIKNNLEVFITDNENKKFDFQSISYIKVLYDNYCTPEEQKSKTLKIEMIFYHMLSNIAAGFNNPSINSSERKSTKKVSEKHPSINKVMYHNMSFKEFLRSDTFKQICIDNGKDILDFFGGDYEKMVEELEISTEAFTDIDTFSGKCFDTIEKYFAPKSKTKQTSEDFQKFLFKIRRGGDDLGFPDNCTFYFFKEDLDEFSGMLDKKIAEINESYASTFKARPVFSDVDICRSCEYLSMCSKNLLFNEPELDEIHNEV